ncbi:MAG TPA: hypothetical protein VL402_10085 [Xanthobacteraceae bacterium]|jgi:hypothetical protein|nr:hypothetical protein [Xanthobacteraceae bacterium]
MTKTWNTEYGPRRVKEEPPTLDQAIFAARGLTDDLQQQAEIAASLMDMPVEKVRAEITKSVRSATQTLGISRKSRVNFVERDSKPAVIVERRPARRAIVGMTRRFGY